MNHNTRALRRLIPFGMVFYSALALAGDIACDNTQKAAERVICDHAILNWQYDKIYDQQQKLLDAGKVSNDQIASWRLERDACTDVTCIDAVFSKWKMDAAADEVGQTSSSEANAALLNHAKAEAIDPSQQNTGSADAAPATQNSGESQGARSASESSSGTAAEANSGPQAGKQLSDMQVVLFLVAVVLVVWGLTKVPPVRWTFKLLVIMLGWAVGGTSKGDKGAEKGSGSKNRPPKDTGSNESASNGRKLNPETLPPILPELRNV